MKHKHLSDWTVIMSPVGETNCKSNGGRSHHLDFDPSNGQHEELLTPKYLNIKCDFERIPGGGCHLRESYCSLHTCICKPDYPINVADRLCISRFKYVGEACQYSHECQNGSYCASKNNQSQTCQCKTGYIYSTKSKQCVKGLFGAACKIDSDCTLKHLFCSLSTCECLVGYQWHAPDEECFKKAKYDDRCEHSVNCKLYDEFSECEQHSKKCTCGRFLSAKYVLDEVTQRCVNCPLGRFNNVTNTCIPEKTTVEYGLIDRSSQERNSHQYVYIALSMTPFIVFALIGFIYRYVKPSGNLTEEEEQDLEAPHMLGLVVPGDYCLSIGGASRCATSPGTISASQANLCLVSEPPPSYELASRDLPPSYDEAIQHRMVA